MRERTDFSSKLSGMCHGRRRCRSPTADPPGCRCRHKVTLTQVDRVVAACVLRQPARADLPPKNPQNGANAEISLRFWACAMAARRCRSLTGAPPGCGRRHDEDRGRCWLQLPGGSTQCRKQAVQIYIMMNLPCNMARLREGAKVCTQVLRTSWHRPCASVHESGNFRCRSHIANVCVLLFCMQKVARRCRRRRGRCVGPAGCPAPPKVEN